MQVRTMADICHNRRPISLPGSATVQQACKLMREHRIGAILVTSPEGRLEGIFTGRDAVRLLADDTGSPHTHLHTVMTCNPSTIGSEHNAVEALRLMQGGGFRHLPVVEGGKVVSIASFGDFQSKEYARLDEETGYWERL